MELTVEEPTENAVPPQKEQPTVVVNPSIPLPSPVMKPCFFFGLGTCRNGDACRFSHIITEKGVPSAGAPPPAPSSPGSSQSHQQAPPPPFIINVPMGHPVYSIDVECVATAVQHNARSIAQVALVDEWSRPVFSVYVKQDIPVVSYITELTGLTKEILDDHGIPLGM